MRELRLEAGYTQAEVAEAVDVQQNTVSRWETGAADPSLDNLHKLSELYNRPIGAFFSNGDDLSDEERGMIDYLRAHPHDRAAVEATYKSLRDSAGDRTKFEHEPD